MERDDLGAMFAQVTRRLIAAERPILATHGLSMWEYIALSRLGAGPAQSQLALARAMGHDKTRLIPLLDGLERRGLLRRVPDEADRRARIVELTSDGRRLLDVTRAEIRVMEEQLLDTIPARQRAPLMASLATLAKWPKA
jgi:DNA-binding MarR family transcriptional regulator